MHAFHENGDRIYTEHLLTLKVPITTKVDCFRRLQNCFKAFSTNSVEPDQTAPVGAAWFGSTLFASILM